MVKLLSGMGIADLGFVNETKACCGIDNREIEINVNYQVSRKMAVP